MKTLLILTCLSSGFAGCHPQDDSEPLGHFEEMDETDAEALTATHPRVIAEYHNTDFVLLSGELLMSRAERGFQHFDMVKSILNSGNQVSVIVGQSMTKGIDEPEFKALKSSLSTSEVSRVRFITSKGGTPSVWARDWGPLQAVNDDDQKILVDLNYYPERPEGDNSAFVLSQMNRQSKRLSVPVYNEGGNFMINAQGYCLMTTRVVDANKDHSDTIYVDEEGKPLRDPDGNIVTASSRARGRDGGGRSVKGTVYQDLNQLSQFRTDDKVLTAKEISDYYRRYAGCKKMEILPRMPIEGTGHIDMWAKFLSDDTILVGEISSEQLKLAKNDEEASAGLAIQTYLEDVTHQLAELGFKLVKIPMPLPQALMREVNGVNGVDTWVIRSFTNSLLVKKAGVKTAIVPLYRKLVTGHSNSAADDYALTMEPYSDASLLRGYQEKVTDAYTKAGYNIDYIVSDDLILNAGAVHCTTMQFAMPL